MKTLKELWLETPLNIRSDKGDSNHSYSGLSYLDVYDRKFSHLQPYSITMLEIGVLFGHSIDLWLRYFLHGMIHGVDINPAAISNAELLKNSRVHLHLKDQSNIYQMIELAREHGPFDIVIDDGSHLITHILASLKCLWPHVKSGGFYVIEDTNITHSEVDPNWPGMTCNKPFDRFNHRMELNQYLEALVFKMDTRKGDVRCLEFHPQQIILTKI